MNIRTAINDYIETHRIENHSDWTISHRMEHLIWFADWLESTHNITDTDDLRVVHLRGWISHLQNRPSMRGGDKLGQRTVRVYAQSMAAFCHWLEYEGPIEKPITTRVRLPQFEKLFIPTFTPDDVEKLLAAYEVDRRYTPRLQKAIMAHNRPIVSVLIDTGIRRQELTCLRLCNSLYAPLNILKA